MNNNIEREITDIYVEDIIPNRFQPRLTFDEKSLAELADSIKLHGIIQPLVVRKVGDKYEIIAGERRYKASQLAGLQKVPAIIMNLDDKQSAEVAVIENIQRKDLTALEEAESYKKLLDKGYLTQEQLASRMGKTQATISNKLRLLNLPEEVKQALLKEKISERHARSLLSLKTPESQIEVLNKIINNKLTVKQTDDLIKSTGSDVVETLNFNNPTGVPVTPSISSPVSDAPVIPPISSPVSDVPVIPIQTPIPPVVPPLPISEVEEDISEQKPPAVPTDLNPITTMDVNNIKEKSEDINPPQQVADIEALLGIKNINGQPISSAPVMEQSAPRFIKSLDDEEANMNMSEVKAPIAPTDSSPISNPFVTDSSVQPVEQSVQQQENTMAQPSSIQQEPTTFTDSLVHEYRQNNFIPAGSDKLVPGDLRSAINVIRDTTQLLEKNEFKIEVEEFDFEHLYQIIIKINK